VDAAEGKVKPWGRADHEVNRLRSIIEGSVESDSEGVLKMIALEMWLIEGHRHVVTGQ
jgi:hypothetical protein